MFLKSWWSNLAVQEFDEDKRLACRNAILSLNKFGVRVRICQSETAKQLTLFHH